MLISELKRSANDNTQSLAQTLRDWTGILLSSKIVLRVSLIIIIVALILTRSRMGNSAFFIALMVMSLLALFFTDKSPKRLNTLLLAFLLSI
nr:hypothetical protein [Pseudoalteromonas sp. WY3]